MLAGPPERLEEALGRLDPTHRALLELSLHREVTDPALAELLRTDVEAVGRQREEALLRIADLLEAAPEDVEPSLIRHWRGEGEEAPEAEEAPPAAEETPETTEAAPERRPRRALWAVIAGAAALGLVLILVLAGGGDDEETDAGNGGGTPAAPPGDSRPPAQQDAEAVELQALFGGDAAGTARVLERGDSRRLELRLSGLSESGYAIWLYNSIGDARRLATARGPAASVSARLREGYERFRYLDVSQEPDDGNRNHSGASVLRVETAELAG